MQAGWGVDAERMQGAFNAILPERKVVNPQGGTVMVFKLPKRIDLDRDRARIELT